MPARSIASRMASRLVQCTRRRLAASALAAVLTVALMAGPEGGLAQSLQDKIAQCAACHGEDGQSKDPKIPHIGGQPKLFVMYQLFFYREGRRKNPEMNTIAKELSDAELDAIAEPRRQAAADPAGGRCDRRGPLQARGGAGATAHLRQLPQPRLLRPRADAASRRPARGLHDQGVAGLPRRRRASAPRQPWPRPCADWTMPPSPTSRTTLRT